MGDVKRGIKRGWRSVRHAWDDVIEGSQQMGEAIGLGSITGKSDKTKRKEFKAQAMVDEANKPIPLPDEEEIERQKRRNASRRRGGRSSTVLTDDDRLGG